MPQGEGVASWKHIRDVFEKDKLMPGLFRSLWKLTDTHMEPKFKKKLCVRLATQVLSHSVAAAIKKDVAQGKQKTLMLLYPS